MAIFFVLVKGSIVGPIVPRYFDVDLIIVILTYLFAVYGEKGAGIFAFALGGLMDLFSGGLFGFYILIYIAIFLAIKLSSRPLDLSSIGTQIVIVSSSVFLKGILMISLHSLFSLRAILSLNDLFVLISPMILSGLITPFFFYIFDMFNRMVPESKKEF
jgi:rod shape-determining protein MreD